jgi:hypothetical protein
LYIVLTHISRFSEPLHFLALHNSNCQAATRPAPNQASNKQEQAKSKQVPGRGRRSDGRWLLAGWLVGLLAGWWAGRGQPPLPRALLMVGVMGGFTTYSTFALETVHLWNAGAAARALAYVLATTLTCVLAAAAGLWLWQQINSIGAAR